MPFRAVKHTNLARKIPTSQGFSTRENGGCQRSPNEPTAQKRHSPDCRPIALHSWHSARSSSVQSVRAQFSGAAA